MPYSVIIRTLTGGGKYLALLESIKRQTVQPQEIYVVQPHGYEPPKETIGRETFIHTEKGMWSQRIFGMEYVDGLKGKPKWLLVCDDDLQFEPDFVEQMIKRAEENDADILIPTKDVHNSLKMRLFQRLTGGRTECRRHNFKITVGPGGSFIVNNHLTNEVNPTQSGQFALFLMRTDITPKLKLREEIWLDQTRYAWPDDQVFFYKAHMKGLNVMATKRPEFIHLDERSGVTDAQRKMDAAYSAGRNGYIFWHRFIKDNPQWSAWRKRLAFLHRTYANLLYQRMRSAETAKAYSRGLKDGKEICKHEIQTIFIAD